MITLRDLIENPDLVGVKHGTDLDIELVVVDPQDEDNGTFALELEYDLPVTIESNGQQRQVILLRVREDFNAVIVHD